MENDPSLQGLVVTLNSSLRLETSALQNSYEKWRASQVELHEQKKVLDEEMAALRAARADLEAKRAEFEARVAAEWGPAGIPPQRRVAVNVGGQRFETTAGILTRDRFSLLAALTAAACAGTGPGTGAAAAKPSVAATVRSAGAAPTGESESKEQTGAPLAGKDSTEASAAAPADDDEADSAAAAAGSAQGDEPAATQAGEAEDAHARADAASSAQAIVAAPPAELFLDRDWWLFRHLLAFLRAGPAALPADVELLRQLYVESAYLRLNSLRVAVERRLSERRVSLAVLDPEFAAAPLTTDMARHGSAGRAGEVSAAADEALAWARWARSNGSAGRDSSTSVPGPLSGAMGGVRNAAALFAAAELESTMPADVEAAGRTAGTGGMGRGRYGRGREAVEDGLLGYGGFGDGDDDELGGVGLTRLVGFVGDTARRRSAMRDAQSDVERQQRAGCGEAEPGWWQWRDDLAAGADAEDGMPGLDGGAEAAAAAAMVGGVASSASLLTAAWRGPAAYGSH